MSYAEDVQRQSGTVVTALVWPQFGSLSQLAEENGSNPFQFRFESEVNYQHTHIARTAKSCNIFMLSRRIISKKRGNIYE